MLNRMKPGSREKPAAVLTSVLMKYNDVILVNGCCFSFNGQDHLNLIVIKAELQVIQCVTSSVNPVSLHKPKTVETSVAG